MNNDGAETAAGRLLCRSCEHRLWDNLAQLGEDAMPLLLIATRQAGVNMQGSGHASPAEAPSPLRDDLWELYCEAEQLMRRLCARFDYPKTLDPHITVVGLARMVLARPGPLLKSGDVLGWYEDIADMSGRVHKAVNPAKPRIAFGSCPDCGGVVWGDPDESDGECASCGERVNRRAVADRLLARLIVSEVRGTATELSAECAKAGIRLPASTIRSWVNRGGLRYRSDGKLSLSELVPLLRKRADYGKEA
ncbi:hypothetical protein JS533_005090 [Bifidobacterium amazonense]|uniref:PhnA protein n=1 Tax=Bifidobacterium amazonense TaxID=2809027 RepID=A0ABS9VU77_9BIFI|nr:hypothetical protein [Bifidobacterium amazonense]MCH9275648.1 hypothetical protein [Bifidobacterium amazonense]